MYVPQTHRLSADLFLRVLGVHALSLFTVRCLHVRGSVEFGTQRYTFSDAIPDSLIPNSAVEREHANLDMRVEGQRGGLGRLAADTKLLGDPTAAPHRPAHHCAGTS